jgi:hypothetical protein
MDLWRAVSRLSPASYANYGGPLRRFKQLLVFVSWFVVGGFGAYHFGGLAEREIVGCVAGFEEPGRQFFFQQYLSRATG